MAYNKCKTEILYRVPINVIKSLEKNYVQLENSYYINIDTTKLTDQISIIISIRSVEGFKIGEYDMITAHIEDLIEDEYRKRRKQIRENRQKEREKNIHKVPIKIKEAAIPFVIGKNRSNIKRICGKFKGAYIDCPRRGSGSTIFVITTRSEKDLNKIVDMLIESEKMVIEKIKKNNSKNEKLKKNENEI